MHSVTIPELEVHQVDETDIYKDIARIHESQRDGIKEGTICKLSVHGKSKLVAIRGLRANDHEHKFIRIDEITRDRLGIGVNERYSFKLNPVGLVGQLVWGWSTSEPSLRLAVRLGIISLVLGVISLVVAFFPTIAHADIINSDEIHDNIKQIRAAAEQGDSNAQFKLGYAYYNGIGLTENDVEAVKWWEKAANNNNPKAQFFLSTAYFAGKGVIEDWKTAFEWNRKAAELGDADAQFELGKYYKFGWGTSKNLVLAYMWENIASVHNLMAPQVRSTIENNMTPEQIAEGQRLSREWIQQHIKP